MLLMSRLRGGSRELPGNFLIDKRRIQVRADVWRHLARRVSLGPSNSNITTLHRADGLVQSLQDAPISVFSVYIVDEPQ
jgi:hypothetical protein